MRPLRSKVTIYIDRATRLALEHERLRRMEAGKSGRRITVSGLMEEAVRRAFGQAAALRRAFGVRALRKAWRTGK